MSHTVSGELSRRQQKVEAGLSQCLWQMETSRTVQTTMSCWQEVQNCRDVCGNTKSFNLPYKRRKHGVWFTSQHHHTRIHRITAETLECNGAHLSLTLHSLFPLLLFFSLFTSFLSSQRLCRKCTLEFIFESDKRNACHFLFMPSPYGHMKKCTGLIEGFSMRLPLQAHQTLNIKQCCSCPLRETLRIKHPM